MGRPVDNNSPFRTLLCTYSASHASIAIHNGLKTADSGPISDLSDAVVQQLEASFNRLNPLLKDPQLICSAHIIQSFSPCQIASLTMGLGPLRLWSSLGLFSITLSYLVACLGGREDVLDIACIPNGFDSGYALSDFRIWF